MRLKANRFRHAVLPARKDRAKVLASRQTKICTTRDIRRPARTRTGFSSRHHGHCPRRDALELESWVEGPTPQRHLDGVGLTRCDDAGAGVEARRPANLRKTSSRTDLDATTGGPYDETPYDGGLRTTKTRRHFTLGMAP